MATPRLSSRAQLNSHIVCRDLTNGATPSIVTLGLDPRAHGRAWRLASAIDPGSHSLRSLGQDDNLSEPERCVNPAGDKPRGDSGGSDACIVFLLRQVLPRVA